MRRDDNRIAVVEDLRDLLAIEGTGHFRGRYHVLGGVISPMDGVDRRISGGRLGQQASSDACQDYFALPTTIRGHDGVYLDKRLRESKVEIATLARGVAVGDELQYADELTLIRSLQQQLPYEQASRARKAIHEAVGHRGQLQCQGLFEPLP